MNDTPKTDEIKIPFAKEIESQFKKAKILSLLTIIITTILNAGIIFLALIYADDHPLLVFIFPMLLFIYIIFQNFNVIVFRKKILLNKFSEKTLGSISIKQLKSEINQMTSDYKKNKKEIPGFYILKDSFDSPHVIDLYFLNFIKPLNAVYLPEYLFYFFKIDEIKSIISHELAHFYSYILPTKRFIFPVYFFIIFICFIPVFLLNAFFFTSILFSISAAIFMLAYFNKNCFSKIEKFEEYLSDLHAAKKHGKLNYINALLIFEHFDKILSAILADLLEIIKEDNNLSIKDLSMLTTSLIKNIPYKKDEKSDFNEFIKNEIKLNRNLKRKQIIAKQQKNETKIINNLLKGIKENADNGLLEWEKFDTITKNYRVEPEEYPLLIKELKHSIKNKNYRIKLNKSQTDIHPSIAHRILFLEKNMKD